MRWLLLAAVWLAYGAFGLVAASLAPLAVVLQGDLGISYAAMGSIMGAWQLVYIGAAIPCGLLLDRLGARRALLLGVLLVAASAAGRALAENYWQLLAAVGLFGVGGPIISSGAPKVVAGAFSGSQRGLAMGIYMTGPTLGGVIALTATHSVLLPAFGGDWRNVFWLWCGLALGAGVLWFAVATLAAGRVTGFGAGGTAGADGGSGSVRVIGQILAVPAVRLLLLMAIGAFLFNHGLNNWLPELLRSGGMTAAAAGYWAALPMVVGIAGSLTIPRLATPERRFTIVMLLCMAASVASLALLTTEPVVLTGALLLQGLVRSSLMTVLVLTLMELPQIDARHAGTASGLFFSAAEIGGVLGPLGLGVVFDISGGFDAGLYLLAALTAAMALASLWLKSLATR